MSLYVIIFLLVWIILLLYLLTRYHFKMESFLIVVVPLTLLLLAFILTFPRPGTAGDIHLPGTILAIHVILSFLSYAIFTLSLCAAVIYLIQERLLKKKILHLLYKSLPSLEVLENISFKFVRLGLPLLGLGILSGMLWSKLVHGDYLRFSPKEIWSFFTLLIYGGYFGVRQRFSFSRHKLTYLLILGSGLIIVSYLGVQIF